MVINFSVLCAICCPESTNESQYRIEPLTEYYGNGSLNRKSDNYYGLDKQTYSWNAVIWDAIAQQIPCVQMLHTLKDETK